MIYLQNLIKEIILYTMKKELKNYFLLPFNILSRISPELNMRILFRIKCGYSLNLKNPTTYNEKLNWLKLYYRNDLLPKCADKFKARDYIIGKGYGEYLPKLYWHGEKPEEIPFDMLPNSFVIKSTSGSGNNIIVHDKNKLDIKKVKGKINKWLKEKYLPAYGEWHYEKIKPSIIVEQFLSDGTNEVPADYKLFCFNGLNGGVMCTAVDIDRFIGHRRLIYSDDWKYLADVDFGFDNAGKDLIPKPVCYERMCEIAKDLAQPFPHCRVDFFVIKDKLYIGEITFFNGAGFDKVSPREYNIKMGEAILLPTKNK